MARHESSGELAGHLAASLTPRVAQVTAPSRGAQSSGLFDMSALYAEALGKVGRRAKDDPRLAPLVRARDASWLRSPPAVTVPWPAGTYDRDAEHVVADPFGFDDASSVSQSRGRGLGWFGVAVAWLATVTLAAGLAVGLPAHVASRSHVVVAGLTPAAATDPRALQPIEFVERAPRIEASIPSALVSMPVSSSVVIAVETLPVAARTIMTAGGAGSVLSPAAGTEGRPSIAQTRASRTKSARSLATPAAVSHLPAAPAVANATAPTTPAPAVAVKPAGASTDGMSLEDLIRHEVQADSAKLRR